MVVDKVVVSRILLAVTTMLPVLSGDGATVLLVVLGDIKVKPVVDLLLILRIVQTSTTKAKKKTLTKGMKSSVMPTEKNNTATRNKNSITSKDRRNMKNSTRQKLENRKKSRLRMLIGSMSLEFDIRH